MRADDSIGVMIDDLVTRGTLKKGGWYCKEVEL